MRVLIVDTDPANGTRVLEVVSVEVALRVVQGGAERFVGDGSGQLAKGATWSAHRPDGTESERTIVILEVP